MSAEGAAISEQTPVLDCTLIPVKLPKWLKKQAEMIGVLTGEDIGQVIERLCGEAVTREYRDRTTAAISGLPELGEAGA